ncbi:streptococcal hemagglutinin-like [Montipora foliosa]|uniref:streptococcal hemagglutinin-like n=1 Tax=Montipora foliosa TaxID=591990 RepID=UPI0035F11F11
MDSFIEMPPEEDPENMPTATEELLQLVEDFADYIEKFMFEIVTFLAVVDSAMGLIKDVLGLFGFEGWKMAFFPTFSFIVTTGVFLFGAKKRKGKRDADVPEGLEEAFDAIENVMEVVEDVAEELDDIDKTKDGNADGELVDVLGDVTGLPTGSVSREMQGRERGNEGDVIISDTPADDTQSMARKVIAVTMMAASIIAKVKKKRKEGQDPEGTAAMEVVDQDEGNYCTNDKNQKAGTGLETLQETAQQSDGVSKKGAAKVTGAASSKSHNRKPSEPATDSYNNSVILDLNLATQEKGIADIDLQNVARSGVISAEPRLRQNTTYLVKEVKHGASEIKREIGGTSLTGTSNHKEGSLSDLTHPKKDDVIWDVPIPTTTNTMHNKATAQQSDWVSKKGAAKVTGAASSKSHNRKPPEPATDSYNNAVIIDLNLATQEKGIADIHLQNVARSGVISAERRLRQNTTYLVKEVKHGASEIKREIGGTSLTGTSNHIEDSLSDLTHPKKDDVIWDVPIPTTTNTLEMASGMVKNTTDLAGSTAQNVDQQARRGLEETRKKSGSILHIAIRLVRLIVRVVNKKKGGSSTGSPKGEESIEKGASTDIKGSTLSLESDSIYFDCVSVTPKQSQLSEPVHASNKSFSSTGTQTDLGTQSHYFSEPQFLHQDAKISINDPRRLQWANLRQSLLSMPDTSVVEIRDTADEEMRFRGSRSQPVLRPAWLGSRNEVDERLSQQLSHDNESHLDDAASYSRSPETRPNHDENPQFQFTRRLKAPVMLHSSRDSREQNQISGSITRFKERETNQMPNTENLLGNTEGDFKSGSSLNGSVLTAQGRTKSFVKVSNGYRNGATEQNKFQRIPVDWINDSEGAKLDARTLATTGKSENENGDYSAQYNRAYSEETVYLYEQNLKKKGRANRVVREPENNRENEGFDEYEDRGSNARVKSTKHYDLRGSRRSMDSKPRALVRSVSYEETDEIEESEEVDRSQDTDWKSERSTGNTKYASKTKREKYSIGKFPPKSSNRSQSTVGLHKDEKPCHPQRSTAPSPMLPSDSSESLESSRSLAKRSNISLSSVRFADEDASFSSTIHKQESKRGKYMPQSKRQSGSHNFRRRNGRWNSAICLTGHQNGNMSLSPHGCINDDYISDEINLPSGRQAHRKTLNRGPTFARNSRGSFTVTRVRSASYLGDDESDERTR